MNLRPARERDPSAVNPKICEGNDKSLGLKLMDKKRRESRFPISVGRAVSEFELRLKKVRVELRSSAGS